MPTSSRTRSAFVRTSFSPVIPVRRSSQVFTSLSGGSGSYCDRSIVCVHMYRGRRLSVFTTLSRTRSSNSLGSGCAIRRIASPSGNKYLHARLAEKFTFHLRKTLLVYSRTAFGETEPVEMIRTKIKRGSQNIL